jgi:N-acetylmuramoyl-L-alanine amidase
MIKIYLDAGHGGLKNGRYTTSPNKQFRHPVANEFHGGGWFFEGVFNRALVAEIEKRLQEYNIPCLVVSHPTDDITLAARVKRANDDYRAIRTSTPFALYVSVHANASPTHTARGWEVFAINSTGQGARVATLMGEEYKKAFIERFRGVKQANFFVLKHTIMPAVLTENFFFDQIDDARMMMREDVVRKLADVHVNAINKYIDTIV